jgi:transcriptional regulator with XRE-family HTH domain
MASRIKEARRDRDWSQTRLIAEMERAAGRRGKTLPSRETLKSRISRWENGHSTPDDFYRLLLREAFGLDDGELGFAIQVDFELTAADELRTHLVMEAEPATALVSTLAAQTDAVRRQDRQYGAGRLLEQMRSHVANLEQHLSYSALESTRRPLAWLLADAAALTGWQALDVAAADQAWRLFEISTRAALQAWDPQLYAFARLEQAHVLADLGAQPAAAELAVETWRGQESAAGPPMRCWLAAATAEMLAGAGQTQAARQFMATAESLAAGLDEERPPYLVFDQVHLQRWMAHSLVLMHDPAAEPILRSVGERMDRTFTRAGAGMHLDLAASLLLIGADDEAKVQLAAAEGLARRVGSRRQLARAQSLRAAS